MIKHIAFLGLGAMGSRMVRHLCDAGYQVSVWNRDPSKANALKAVGALAAASPRKAAEGADLVFSMVRDDDASRSVWTDSSDGALLGLAPGAMAIECSTLSLGWTQALARFAQQAGVRFAEAPVLGSRPQAESAQLIFLVGSESSLLQELTPVLQTMGRQVLHAGPIGTGMAMKLALNTLFSVQVAALAEMWSMLSCAGVAPDTALAIFNEVPVVSPAARGAAQSMLSGSFAPQFPVELVEKDLCYTLSAQPSGQFSPMAQAARLVYQRAIDAGFGGDHLTRVISLYPVG
jgi:3-hydroxyisobutyrate dehydrogenase